LATGASRIFRTCCARAFRNRGVVYGPMAEVVYNSLQYLSDADIRAMAVYLKSLAEGSPPRAAATSIRPPKAVCCYEPWRDSLR